MDLKIWTRKSLGATLISPEDAFQELPGSPIDVIILPGRAFLHA